MFIEHLSNSSPSSGGATYEWLYVAPPELGRMAAHFYKHHAPPELRVERLIF
jgi:hypothetical protein